MSRSKIARLLIATALVATSMVASLLVATPAGANVSVATSGPTTPGSVVSVSSAFTAPNKSRGNYVVDTEIFDANGKRVAQFSEKLWLGWSTTYRKYSWNTSGLAAGKYRIAQGIFTLDWSVNRSWVKEASTVTLSNTAAVAAPAPATTAWQLSSTVNGTGNVSVKANFTVPNNFTSSNVVLDTEIYNATGTKVAQWAENAVANPGQTHARSYTWDTNGKPAGAYTVRQGAFVPDWSRNLAWNANAAKFDVAAAVATIVKPVTELVAPQPQPAPTSASFWVDPSNPALRQAREWQASRPTDAALMNRMGQGAAAVWLGGWNANVKNDVTNITTAAAASGKTPVFVAYNIPGRDCGSYSAGGSANADSYRTWVRGIADGIGDRKAWVVLEPDALSQLDCLNAGAKAERLSLLNDATTLLNKPNVNVYIDAGHPGWHSASDMAERLRSAGVAKTRGFSLNVSNFGTTQENVAYGESVASLLGGKRYLVDTARNGNGSNGEWCNPSGRALGEMPTTSTGTAHGDAFLWVKRPGESDGTCNGGPNAGEWWADYALGLAQRAKG